MNNINEEEFRIEDEIWTLDEYLEEIGASKYSISDLDEFEEKLGSQIWNYPISEIEHCIENGGSYVIVAFRDYYGGYEHRICELKEAEFEEED